MLVEEEVLEVLEEGEEVVEEEQVEVRLMVQQEQMD